MKMAESALAWYQKALKVLDFHKDNGLTVQKYKIQQCLVSTQFNCCDPGRRAENEEIRRWFLEMDYLQLVESVVSVVKDDSWNWIVARNGLVAASILQNFEKCQLFWEVMQKVNKSFKNLDFVPSQGLLSIRQDSDLVWFVRQVTKE